MVWSDWSKAFGFFPLKGQFPRVLVPIMECARDNGTKELKKRRGQKASYSWQASPWTIHREAAKKHLRLNAGSWMRLRAINYEFSRKGGNKRLYLLDDVLREATVNFDSLASLEKRLVRCEKADATREKARRMREEMWEGRRLDAIVLADKHRESRGGSFPSSFLPPPSPRP